MNHVYRLIWREAAGGFVAVAEMARACGARTSSKAVAVSCALVCAAGAHAAPGTGFNPVEGSATLASSGATTTVNQTTNGVRIEWQTLNVAAGETLKFVQPSASAVALNIIKGGVATEILGNLQANGNVFILNPNGVLVGAGAQVTVGGFMASTDDLVSFNAANGGTVLQANNSAAEVRNAGSIIATQGGMVALVGNKVINTGTILAPGGGIYLLGGGRAEFKPGDGSPFTYSLTTDSVRNKSVENTSTGVLRANGGQIVMDARTSKQAVVNARGVLDASAVSQGPDGSIRLTALGGNGQITLQTSKNNLKPGSTGTVTAQLDAGGTFTKLLGDPNSPGAPSQNPDVWLSAQDKTYDGTTAATVTIDVKQLAATNYFAFKLNSADFASRNADTAANVLVNGTITGQGFLSNLVAPATLQATIHKAALTITTSDVTKTYDGDRSASGTAVAGTGTGLKGTDSLAGGTFEYDNKNAGSGKTVTVAGVTVNDGNNGNNYDVTYASNTSSTVNKADLTITSSNVTKTYNGLLDASGTALVGAGTSLKGTDGISGGTFTYTDKNAGSGKTVTVAGVTINDGNNGNNYNVTYASNTTSTINRAGLILSAVTDNKAFDTTTLSAAAPQASGLVSTDTIGGLSQSFDSSAAGARVINVNGGYTITDGNGGNNYEVTLVSATGTITSPPPNTPPTTPDLGPIINNGGTQPTAINVDLAGLGDLLAQLPPTAAGEDEDPEKIKARRRSDRSPLRVTGTGVNTPPALR